MSLINLYKLSTKNTQNICMINNHWKKAAYYDKDSLVCTMMNEWQKNSDKLKTDVENYEFLTWDLNLTTIKKNVWLTLFLGPRSLFDITKPSGQKVFLDWYHVQQKKNPLKINLDHHLTKISSTENTHSYFYIKTAFEQSLFLNQSLEFFAQNTYIPLLKGEMDFTFFNAFLDVLTTLAHQLTKEKSEYEDGDDHKLSCIVSELLTLPMCLYQDKINPSIQQWWEKQLLLTYPSRLQLHGLSSFDIGIVSRTEYIFALTVKNIVEHQLFNLPYVEHLENFFWENCEKRYRCLCKKNQINHLTKSELFLPSLQNISKIAKTFLQKYPNTENLSVKIEKLAILSATGLYPWEIEQTNKPKISKKI